MSALKVCRSSWPVVMRRTIQTATPISQPIRGEQEDQGGCACPLPDQDDAENEAAYQTGQHQTGHGFTSSVPVGRDCPGSGRGPERR